MRKKPRILECTLRDGSYAVNFQLTVSDTSVIAKALESAGLDMIEVGHGMGFGASDKGRGLAAETDEAYLKAAAESIEKADWGHFCIPGIAELSHIDMAADYGMKFIRIGTNITEYRQAQPFIELAKKHGMLVCANFMKSYASPPEEFAGYAVEAEKFGADIVYIVDSAGGMLPEDIDLFVNAVRERSQTLRLGFHGHHNLALGVANALRAVDLGVEVIDTSLQGFGRSAGNTSTEQFLCALMRKGVDMGIDPVAVMDVGEKYIYPLIESKGINSVDIVSGLALFHSSYMPIIEEFALKYRVDPRKLIISVCKHDRVNAPRSLVEAQAKELAEKHIHGNWKPIYKHYYGQEQDSTE